MKVSLIQLSDMHFEETGNWLAGKAAKLASAVWAQDPTVQFYALLFCGDIAYSGLRSEYLSAAIFLEGLQSSLLERNSQPVIQSAFIPGNHDCDFTAETDTRQMAFDFAGKDIAAFQTTGDVARACLQVQENFFRFATEQTRDASLDLSNRFFNVKSVQIGDFRINLNLYNTAWLSRMHEVQGQLLYPVAAVKRQVADTPPADLVISMLHHPYNWFRQDNAREFKSLVESSSNLILTGHEHEAAAYAKEAKQGLAVHYVEGAVLQQKPNATSAFNLIEVETDQDIYRVSEFRWKAGQYIGEPDAEWKPLRRNRVLSAKSFLNTAEYQQVLDDIGTGFTHPHVKNRLSREDVFLYPDLRRRSFYRKENGEKSGRRVQGSEVVSCIHESKLAVITGIDLSGRSTLARSLYVDLRAKYDLLPVLISGRGLKATNQGEVQRLVDAAITEQYGPNSVSLLNQTKSNEKVLLIDDFHRSLINQRGQKLFMNTIRAAFDFIIIFADDLFALREMSEQSSDERLLSDFETYEISEFGYYLRGKLIEKWVGLGRQNVISIATLHLEVSRHEQVVETVLGRNLLPSHPVTILTILQAVEANNARDSAMGSYGYLYETLILQALSFTQFTPPEINVVMTFLSLAAYKLFAADQDLATQREIDIWTEEYFDRYRVRLPQDAFLRLVSARVLLHEGSAYKFRYNYYGYFFAASYIRDNISKPKEASNLRRSVREMADHIHYERYADTLAFYIYLSKDTEAIEMVVSNARRIYDDLPACDFDKNVSFVNKLYLKDVKQEQLLLSKSTIEENLDEYRRGRDDDREKERASDGLILDRGAKLSYDKGLSDVVKINIANRTLQILGQILRNSPGSLEGEIKARVTSEAYLLGLRTLTAVLNIPQEHFAGLRLLIVEMIKEHRIIRKKDALLERDLITMADEKIIQLSQAMGFGMIRRISQAVGLSDLQETYADVLSGNKTNKSFRIIDIAIQLDHFSSVPEEELKYLDKDLRSNSYAHGVLRDLVLTYLYLRQVDHSKRSRLMSQFGINAGATSRFVDNVDKKRIKN